MTIPHHESEETRRMIERFQDQVTARARRHWPQGRTGATDDGELVFAMAADPKRRVVHVDFGKPIEWFALDEDSAERFIDMLREKLLEMRGVKP